MARVCGFNGRAAGRGPPDARQPVQFRPESLRQPVFTPAQPGYLPDPAPLQGSQEDSPGLQQLLAMGFPKVQYNTVL